MSRRLVVVLFLALALAIVLVPAALAADATTKQVGLVIAFPDGTQHLEVVTVPAKATTFDVLEAASVELVIDTSFGVSVCSINSVGCPASNCFCDSKHFWAYYHLDSTTNQWVSASVGVGSYEPPNGSVEGFAWSGFDANFMPTVQPPVYTFEQIVALTAPTPTPTATATTTPTATLAPPATPTPEPVSVPEPSTLVLLGGGLAGLATFVRVRRSR